MNIIKLRRELEAKREEMRTLLTTAESETRSLNDVEKAKFDELKNSAEELKETIGRAESLEESETRSLDKLEQRKFAEPTVEELRSFLLHDEVSERSMDTGSTGDVMIPEVNRQIMMTLHDDSPIRRLAMNKTTSVRDYSQPIQINGATVAEAAENDVRGETGTPSLTLATATLTEVYAMPKVSQHLLDLNSGFDIAGFVNQSVADAYSEQENQKFADVLNDATESADTPTFGQITTLTLTSLSDVDELRTATKKLSRKYRKRSAWLMPEAQLTALEELKDADNKPLVGTVEKGGSKQFLGYTVEVCEELTDGAMYFGDFNRGMFTVDHTGSMGSVVDRVTEKGQVKYYSYIYSAAALADHKALLKLKTA